MKKVKLLLAFVILLNVISVNGQVQCLNEDFESFNSQSDLVAINGDPILTWSPTGSGFDSDLVSNISGNSTQFVNMDNCGIWDPALAPHGGHNNSVIALPLSCSINPCDKIKVSLDTRTISTSITSNLYYSDVYVNMRLVQNNPITDCTGGILANCLTATTNYTDIRFDISYPGSGFGPWQTFVENIDNQTSNTYNYALIWFDHLPAVGCFTHGLDNVKLEVVETFADAVSIQDTYFGCNNMYEQICGPSGANYSYAWYGTGPGGNTSILLGEDQCFTPTEAGDYVLFVTDGDEEYSCKNAQTITVLDGVPLPILAEEDQICAGELISIDGQGFDNPSYAINWYHNGNLVQTGGTTLLTPFESGWITVEILIDGCDPVSAQVYIKECCPKNVYLSVDCETQQIIIENLPSSIAGYGITSWTFNGQHISPQQLYDTEFDATLGDGVYGVTILFQLDNGEKCKFVLSTEYKEANCCDEVGPIANAHFVNVEGIQQTFTDPYGNVDIPILCDFMLDASNSICEEEYTFNISELDPLTWTTTEIFPWTYFSGPAGTIDLGQFANFTPGQAYLLAFNVGPNGSSVYLPFIYGLGAEVEITNADDYLSLEGTIYGNFEVPIIRCGRLELDGSESTCETGYSIRIESFDPIFPNWNVTNNQTNPLGPGEIYNQMFTGTAPNNIIIPASEFQVQPSYSGYYLVTLSVGPTWTEADYELIWYECDNVQGDSSTENRSSENLISIEDQISVYPNPTNDLISLKTNFDSGTYQLYDVQGRLINKDILTSKETSIDLSRLNAGIYFFQIQSEDGAVYYEKVIKN